MAITGEINQFEVRVRPCDCGHGYEWSELLPIAVCSTLKMARSRFFKLHEIEASLAGEVHELESATTRFGKRWLSCYEFQRAKLRNRLLAGARTMIALVEPCPSLL